jgi:hypothetical protein
VIELVTFCPYLAQRIGLHESILFEIVKEELKHAYHHEYGKFWIGLTRFTWISKLFFLKEYEYEQAKENLVKYKALEFKYGKYTINEDFRY